MTTLATLLTRARYRLRDSAEEYFWADTEVNDALKDAIRALWPDVYIRAVAESGTTGTALFYSLPSGCVRLGKVEVEDANGSYIEVIDWQENTQNGQVVFPKMPLVTGRKLRFTWRSRFNVTTPNHPEELDEAVVIRATAILYEKLLSWRARFDKYSSKLDKEAATVEELLLIIQHRNDLFNEMVDAQRMPPIDARRGRDRAITEGVQPAHSGRRRKAEAKANVQSE